MKKVIYFFALLWVASSLQSCVFLLRDEYLPAQGTIEQTYNFGGFDRLEMGSAFDIRVVQGRDFQVKVKGDKSDVDDLMVTVRGGELQIYYRTSRSRRYPMYVDVVMPTLAGVDFSGASTSTVDGFSNLQEVDILLSGASRSTVNIGSKYLNIDLSGASTLDLSGNSFRTDSQLSGASLLNAFNHNSEEAYINASGASRARLSVSKLLKGSASGASNIRYRGNPQVSVGTSGGSVVERD
ncbi:MAG: head GIN domain-containing protein [Spirosomataceae bacterium]